jgi:hypothetical protein
MVVILKYKETLSDDLWSAFNKDKREMMKGMGDLRTKWDQMKEAVRNVAGHKTD